MKKHFTSAGICFFIPLVIIFIDLHDVYHDKCFVNLVGLGTGLAASVHQDLGRTSLKLDNEQLHAKWTDFTDKRLIYLSELISVVEKCVTRSDTNHIIFHGCIDWHSAVHGHWAILRSYRITQDTSSLSIVSGHFNQEDMHKEYIYLKDNPEFEMPYGRSWFLILMKEYEIVTGDFKFRYIADFVATSLFRYFSDKAFDPHTEDYINHSWAFRSMLDYYSYTGDQKKIETLGHKIFAVNIRGLTLEEDSKGSPFFSKWGNFAHLSAFFYGKGWPSIWINSLNISKAALGPLKKLNLTYSSHHLGINYSRAWAFWSIYRVTNDSKYLKAYLDNINEGFSLHKKYKGAYREYSHWVPQFGIYAITLSMI